MTTPLLFEIVSTTQNKHTTQTTQLNNSTQQLKQKEHRVMRPVCYCTVHSLLQKSILSQTSMQFRTKLNKKTTSNEPAFNSSESLTTQWTGEASTTSLSHKHIQNLLVPSHAYLGLTDVKCELPDLVASTFILNGSILVARLPSCLQCFLQKHLQFGCGWTFPSQCQRSHDPGQSNPPHLPAPRLPLETKYALWFFLKAITAGRWTTDPSSWESRAKGTHTEMS